MCYIRMNSLPHLFYYLIFLWIRWTGSTNDQTIIFSIINFHSVSKDSDSFFFIYIANNYPLKHTFLKWCTTRVSGILWSILPMIGQSFTDLGGYLVGDGGPILLLILNKVIHLCLLPIPLYRVCQNTSVMLILESMKVWNPNNIKTFSSRDQSS